MRIFQINTLFLSLLLATCATKAQQTQTYTGFDRNLYPGDALLPALHQTFSFTGYWLTPPPGETTNTWTGKRALLKQNGFGFLVLSRGLTFSELKNKDAAALGAADGKSAVAAALREGFPKNVIIFLDQEEGGRLLPEQAAYLFAWIDAVRAAGARPGVYCSAIPVLDGLNGQTISTAQDIAQRTSALVQTLSKGKSPEGQKLALWIANDACPPAPGCTIPAKPIPSQYAANSSVYTAAWQYAQSPRRAQISAGCPQNQAPDNQCYAPGIPPSPNTIVDLNTAPSPDPSDEP